MTLWVRTILVTVPSAEVEAARARHLEHLRSLREQGRLRIAGELPEGEGFLEIVEARDLLEAERIARESPLIEEGLCAWMVREWRELEF